MAVSGAVATAIAGFKAMAWTLDRDTPYAVAAPVRRRPESPQRMGGSYDLLGNGKTAIKVSISKYLQASYAGLQGFR